jgi:hypothetical protein
MANECRSNAKVSIEAAIKAYRLLDAFPVSRDRGLLLFRAEQQTQHGVISTTADLDQGSLSVHHLPSEQPWL